jgi:hypothetical protein
MVKLPVFSSYQFQRWKNHEFHLAQSHIDQELCNICIESLPFLQSNVVSIYVMCLLHGLQPTIIGFIQKEKEVHEGKKFFFDHKKKKSFIHDNFQPRIRIAKCIIRLLPPFCFLDYYVKLGHYLKQQTAISPQMPKY